MNYIIVSIAFVEFAHMILLSFQNGLEAAVFQLGGELCSQRSFPPRTTRNNVYDNGELIVVRDNATCRVWVWEKQPKDVYSLSSRRSAFSRSIASRRELYCCISTSVNTGGGASVVSPSSSELYEVFWTREMCPPLP